MMRIQCQVGVVRARVRDRRGSARHPPRDRDRRGLQRRSGLSIRRGGVPPGAGSERRAIDLGPGGWRL